MDKQKMLNWIGVFWFFINLPFIPFEGSFMNMYIGEYFASKEANVVTAVTTFIVFFIILFLSKIWSNSYTKAPVILSFIPFLLAFIQLAVTQDYLISNRPMLFKVIFVVLFIVVLVAVVKGRKGELNKEL